MESVITKWDSFNVLQSAIIKWSRFYELQNGAIGITKRGNYYKAEQ